MKIVYDENIPYGGEAFSRLGEAVSIPGREIQNPHLLDADLLIVRSVTRVDRKLLEGTPVRFVGTATIGTDHIDRGYLESAGIAFSDAAGGNAHSVSEYVTAAVVHLEKTQGRSFQGKTAGIIGVGNVGRRVKTQLEALGLRVLLNDPPREEREGSDAFSDLGTLLKQADLITLHTPLTRTGKHPTFHLLSEKELNQMKKGSVLFNTSRGSVVDGKSLLASLDSGHLGAAVLDVWENEPTPDPNLVAKVDIATPHIAGYSLDGKLNGTRMMFEAAARYLGVDEEWEEGWNPRVENPRFSLSENGRKSIWEAVLRVYPIHEDDARMRGILQEPPEQQAAYFDRLRKEYPVRREFPNYQVRGGEGETLRRLGFR